MLRMKFCAKKPPLRQAANRYGLVLKKKVEARNHFKKQNKLKINSMKKYFLLVPIIGLTFSCSGEKKQTEKSPEEFQEKIEVIENSTQKLDETIEKSESEIEKKQNEIDSLLKNI